MMTKTWTKRIAMLLLCACCLGLAGCNANVGVGLSVGVPVGDHGYISVGGNSWH
jgi:predicted small secreted protein